MKRRFFGLAPLTAKEHREQARERAKLDGLTVYYIGKRCCRGHTEGWRTDNDKCVVCFSIKINGYYRPAPPGVKSST